MHATRRLFLWKFLLQASQPEMYSMNAGITTSGTCYVA